MPQMCPNCSCDNPDYAPTCAYCGEPLCGLLGCNTILEGRYQVTRVLGCGGMGAVYLADDTRIQGRRVAVKENLNTTSQAQSQFQYEVSLMVRLNHPGLPDVSDQFMGPGGRQYMVMDYVEGETLEDAVGRRGPLPEAEVIALAEQLLDVLEHLHSHSVVHRDVKPANVKITPSGKPVLVDFGIAKLHAPGLRTQTWGRGFGSPGFAPLEQYGTGTDARSDLYSLGAVMYFLLTGQVPAEAPELAAGTRLTPPRQLRSDLSSHVQSVIFKAMALNTAQRYQSAAEMRQALLGPPRPTMGAPPPPPPVTRPLPWVAIGGAGIAAVVAFVGIVAFLVVVVLGSILRGTPPPTSVAVPRPTATPTPRQSIAVEPKPTHTPTARAPRETPPTETPTKSLTPRPATPTHISTPNWSAYESAIRAVVLEYGEIKVEATTYLDPSRLSEFLVDPVLERQKRSVCWLRNEGFYYTYSNRSFVIKNITFDDDRHATVLAQVSENRALFQSGDIYKDYGRETYRAIYQLKRLGSNDWYIYCFQTSQNGDPIECTVELKEPNPCNQ
ncbi:MAG: protein kinase [Anaerolineae bacterium]